MELIPPAEIAVNYESDSVTFAVIGDYGYSGENERFVADMVKSWNPDFIITTGDNNYPDGETKTLKENIGQYYGDYIYNWDAKTEYWCNGAAFIDEKNRFYPTPVNHDTYSRDGLTPYLNYFTLPGNELYYHFKWGAVSFYSLNSTSDDLTVQYNWLCNKIEADSSVFKVVYFHHSPYSPGHHGNERRVQWNYDSMDIDAVLNGHDHLYSRIEIKEQPQVHYMVNGAGGRALNAADNSKFDPAIFDIFSYDENYGAIKGIATNDQLLFQYFSIGNPEEIIDELIIFPRTVQ